MSKPGGPGRGPWDQRTGIMRNKKVEGLASNRDGQLFIPRLLVRRLQELGDGPVKLTGEKPTNKVSSLQHRYYRGVVVPMLTSAMCELQGEEFTTDEIHEFFARKYLPKKEIVDPETAEVTHVRTSTADLDTIGMMDYWEQCVKFGAEILGIDIPPPDPEWRDNKFQG